MNNALAYAASAATIFTSLLSASMTAYAVYVTSRQPVKRDFFISYTTADEKWAVWLDHLLKQHGYTTFFQKSDVPEGESFLKWVNGALNFSENFIAIWSGAYGNSEMCMTECEAAYEKRIRGEMNLFLPVRVEDVEIGGIYRTFVPVDLVHLDLEESERRLLEAVKDVGKEKARKEKRSLFPGLRRAVK